MDRAGDREVRLDKWGTEDPAAEAAKQRLSHLRLALLLGSVKAGQADVPDWTRTTITGFALLMPFTATPGWQIVTAAGEPGGRDPSAAEQASWADAAKDLSALNLDNVQMAIDRFLLAATERTSAPDALVDADEGMVLEAFRLALRVLSAIFYSSQWLLNTPKSADRGLERRSSSGSDSRVAPVWGDRVC